MASIFLVNALIILVLLYLVPVINHMSMLTKKEIALIKKSWTSFSKIDPLIIGDIFYSKLFFSNPELRKMFPPGYGRAIPQIC